MWLSRLLDKLASTTKIQEGRNQREETSKSTKKEGKEKGKKGKKEKEENQIRIPNASCCSSVAKRIRVEPKSPCFSSA